MKALKEDFFTVLESGLNEILLKNPNCDLKAAEFLVDYATSWHDRLIAASFDSAQLTIYDQDTDN